MPNARTQVLLLGRWPSDELAVKRAAPSAETGPIVVDRENLAWILPVGLILLALLTVFPALALGETPRVAVDTDRLMGSPVPMPLQAERVFPHLQFQRPLEFTHAGDGTDRIFVVEQQGVIRVFPNRQDVRQASVFLDIRDVVSRRNNEEGLLGLAFHPDYRDNGRFFVYYSTTPRASIVSEFQVSAEDPDRAQRESERRLMRIPQPFGNHNGGSIKFGPDGYLYIGLGDGDAAHDPHGNGQNLQTLLGSILRIDVDQQTDGRDYGIPADNPFATKDDARPEIWAYGLRNVWRLGFDRATGELWAGDVGQNRYEEIDRIVRGGNYGWKIREGFHPFDLSAPRGEGPLIDPVAEYFHTEGRSVTGGLVYRGERLPEFVGQYFYADYVSGAVWCVAADTKMPRREGESVAVDAAEGSSTGGRKVATTGLPITAFGEDQAGEMYFTAFDGNLHRFSRSQGNLDPIAAAFPRRLSETGLFTSTAKMTPADGLVPYDVNVPLWSDGADKQRLIALPATRSITYQDRRDWGFPEGTVLVKTFLLPIDQANPARQRRLETRLMVHNARGWVGYTYQWNDEQTDAVLLDDAKEVAYTIDTPDGPTTQTWYYPSRADCMACHTPSAGFVLGLSTRQMNRQSPDGDQKVNQIERLARLEAFANPPEEPAKQLESYPVWGERSAPVDRLARAYLDANCAMCHAPGALRGGRPDFSFHTPLAEAGLIDVRPGQGSVGPPGSRLISPGFPERSEVLQRIATRGPRRMPPLATDVPDREAIDVIRRWIGTMDR